MRKLKIRNKQRYEMSDIKDRNVNVKVKKIKDKTRNGWSQVLLVLL